ncbi:MAG: response regulator transcription factor [Gammaproteobacteria bacterium]|nr:response regulator transcription factor [Gammaproteobacteria bacterium]
MLDNPQRILLVEDDTIFAEVITRSLEKRKFLVKHASSSEEALALIQSEGFEYAILDLNLGGETSLKLIPPLKKIISDIQILILTGYASIATAVEAIKLGADNYLAKPADADEIVFAMTNKNRPTTDDSTISNAGQPMSIGQLEWEHIQRVLMANDGNISATSRQLKMHRRTLQRKLQKKPKLN